MSPIRLSRRQLAPRLVAASLLAAGAAAQTVTVERVAVVPGQSTSLGVAPGLSHQFFATAKHGRVWIVRGNSVPSTPALDIRAQVNQNGENGLLGIAFHPNFTTNRRLYLFYTRVSAVGDSVISEFTMVPGSDDFIDPQSERVLVGPIPQVTQGHKAGDLEFGPDGYLYASLGDGDAGSALGLGITQDLSSPRGKVLRIDVDAPPPHVPPTNPFVQTPGANPLVWAYGLRNPWRIALDSATGALFVADVGNSSWEELDLQPNSTPGLNFGWPCREGLQCQGNAACACPSPNLTDPFFAIPHVSGSSVCAIVGGVLLRGSDIPRLEGHYIFSDFCTSALWAIEDPYGAAHLIDLTPELDPLQQTALRFIVDFAQGPAGELLFITHYSGEVWRVRPRPGFQAYCSAVPNSTGAGATLAASGSPSIAVADLHLDMAHLPPGAPGIVIASESRALEPLSSGLQGTLCLGQPLWRWSNRVLVANAAGSASLVTDLSDLPFGGPPTAGETWNFQYWTRDANPTATANLSNAVAVTFAP